jgi:UDP-N-acetylglucosamine 3-dehydrogenase
VIVLLTLLLVYYLPRRIATFTRTPKKRSPLSVELKDGTCPEIGIVGCGAICESYYLQSLKRHRGVLKRATLVDTNETRLRQISATYGTSCHTKDYREIIEKVDGVIIATPHFSHHSIAMDFLREGVHVLCEKPLAVTAPHAKEMLAQAEKSKVTLSVNNNRRLYPSYKKVKELLVDGSIGELRSISYFAGEDFRGWPTVSGFYFDRQQSPRGVLLDQGAHALDAICWWLGHKPDLVSCRTDSFGGPEAVAWTALRDRSCQIEVRLSWLAKLQNRYLIEGDRGTIFGGTEDWDRLKVTLGSAKPKTMTIDTPPGLLSAQMVDNFLNVVSGSAEPLIPAKEVVDSIELIDQCYDAAERFTMPWCDKIESF